MKLALMQPYFFPYIGYWQLIAASDVFVLLDDVQFIRGGWIERNRILNPHGGWQYIHVALQRHSHTEKIRNVCTSEPSEWKRRLLAQVSHYRRLAPHYAEIRDLIESTVRSIDTESICSINAAIVRTICVALGLDRTLLVASERAFDYTDVKAPGDWALHISRQLGAHTYINPAAGAHLFDADEFACAGISLRFLEPDSIIYDRAGEFIPKLSIIDVLMFNGIAGTRSMLGACRLVGS